MREVGESAAAPGPPGVAIEADGLEFRYGSGPFHLRVPELRLAPGQRLAVVGPSGCGKSTLLHLIAGILVPAGGRLAVDGVEPAAASEADRRRFRITRIGLVFQELELLEHLTVRENVILPFLVHSALQLDAEIGVRAHELARQLGVEQHLPRRPRHLSQGERQRVAVCRALVTRPGLILADEPTGNLDPDSSRRVRDVLLEESLRHRTTVVFVTHDHGLLDAFDHVLDLGAFAVGAER